MPLTLFLAAIAVIGVAAFVAARGRAAGQTDSGVKQHSRPHYHGWWALLLATIPALFLLIVWSISTSIYVERRIEAQLPPQAADATTATRSLELALIRGLANGLRTLDETTIAGLPSSFEELRPVLAAKGVALAPDTQDYMIPVALDAIRTKASLDTTGGVLAVILAMAGAVLAVRQVRPRAAARNRVEQIVQWLLLGSSMIAILTTIGIVLSMLFETFHFFSSVSPLGFFFGTVWDPRFAAAGAAATQGQFGLIPLLAGTLYIALVALLVAVPIGLMSAVYMAEYASRGVRSVVKPALELLAGIPTIVYGIFALVTLGPFLRDLSAALTGGTPFIQAQSIFTAGLVMGIMLIPVVSSLSDDIITAVPRAMRDGSLGLGATRSETIKKVILPAALPGIVGAILLTASRAVGETMIVVLAAGVAANLTLNPFEAMTTITVKIVNQLTGDLEFNSPQTLVAFALGITLFCVTLIMNIAALYIVRKYREQYE
jgi:phosphate transport system permease protein